MTHGHFHNSVTLIARFLYFCFSATAFTNGHSFKEVYLTSVDFFMQPFHADFFHQTFSSQWIVHHIILCNSNFHTFFLPKMQEGDYVLCMGIPKQKREFSSSHAKWAVRRVNKAETCMSQFYMQMRRFMIHWNPFLYPLIFFTPLGSVKL